MKARVRSFSFDANFGEQTLLVSFEITTENNHFLVMDSIVTGDTLSKLCKQELVELAWDKIKNKAKTQIKNSISPWVIIDEIPNEEEAERSFLRTEEDVKILCTAIAKQIKDREIIYDLLKTLNTDTANTLRIILKEVAK